MQSKADPRNDGFHTENGGFHANEDDVAWRSEQPRQRREIVPPSNNRPRMSPKTHINVRKYESKRRKRVSKIGVRFWPDRGNSLGVRSVPNEFQGFLKIRIIEIAHHHEALSWGASLAGRSHFHLHSASEAVFMYNIVIVSLEDHHFSIENHHFSDDAPVHPRRLRFRLRLWLRLDLIRCESARAFEGGETERHHLLRLLLPTALFMQLAQH